MIYSPTIFGSEAFFRNEEFSIVRDLDQYLWEDSDGNWERFDIKGRTIAKGIKTVVTQQLTYSDENSVKPTAILDSNGSKVFEFEYDVEGNLSAVQDLSSRKVEYHYVNGLLTSVIDILGHEFIYQYDSKNRLIRKTDTLGRSEYIAYSANGDVASVLNEEGRANYFSFGYDKATKERLAQITTASGKLTEVWYNDEGDVLRAMVNGRLIRTEEKDGRIDITTDDKGNVTRVTRDQWGKVTRIVYPDGSEVKFEYENQFHQIKKSINQLGVVSLYSYDEQGNLIRLARAVGTNAERVTSYEYDLNNQLISQTLEADENTVAATIQLTYDNNGNISTIIDPEGNKVEFLSYDILGNPLLLKDARNNEWSFNYDAKGRLKYKTDPEGNKTAYEYDSVDNLVTIVDANNQRFEYSYNQRNQIVSSTDPFGNVQLISYNSDGLPILFVDEQDRIVSNEFDNEERLKLTRVGKGDASFEILFQYDDTKAVYANSFNPVQIDYPTYSSRNYYDRLQHVVRKTDVLDDTTELSSSKKFDVIGNIISETDEEGRIKIFQYDAMNRLIQSVDQIGGTTTYEYNDQDKLISLTDPNGGKTAFKYDRNRRLTDETRPMGETYHYEYDAVGNRTTAIDAKGQLIRKQFSPVNLMVQEQHFSAGDHITAVKTITYSYDSLGRLTSYDDGLISTANSYDALGHQIAVSTNYNGFILDSSYTYYPNGLKKSFTGGDGVTYQYFYDEASRLSAIELTDGQRITYNSYEWNKATRITFPGGSAIDYSYDALQQLTDIHSKDPIQETVLQYRYEYSSVGNVTAKFTEHGDYQYKYDLMDRLLEASSPVLADEIYTYDFLGNRKTDSSILGEWHYDLNNRLLNNSDKSFTYDDNGNLHTSTSTQGNQLYIYDVNNRLVRVEKVDGSIIADYYYDPFGRRLWKEVDGVKTFFNYSDEGLVAEVNSDGTFIKTYGYQPGSLWTTDPVFQEQDGQYFWYQNDHLNTPQKLISNSGIQVWSSKYSAFGRRSSLQQGIENHLSYPGQFLDVETGNFYNYQRYFSSSMGRYLTSDAFEQEQSLNLYLYANNNPIRYIDPTGEFIPIILGHLAKEYAKGVAECYLKCSAFNFVAGLVNSSCDQGDCLPGCLNPLPIFVPKLLPKPVKGFYDAAGLGAEAGRYLTLPFL